MPLPMKRDPFPCTAASPTCIVRRIDDGSSLKLGTVNNKTDSAATERKVATATGDTTSHRVVRPIVS